MPFVQTASFLCTGPRRRDFGFLNLLALLRSLLIRLSLQNRSLAISQLSSGHIQLSLRLMDTRNEAFWIQPRQNLSVGDRVIEIH